MTDFTKPVQTRDGRKVRTLCTDRLGYESVVCLITEEGGREVVACRTSDGRFRTDKESKRDLINVPGKRVVWVNMYPRDCTYKMEVSRTESDANEASSFEREARVRVEYEVGQFDEEPEPQEGGHSDGST